VLKSYIAINLYFISFRWSIIFNKKYKSTFCT